MKASFIKEAQYLRRIANVVMVKKVNGIWRIYINYTDLNKVCLRDSFPLSRIDCLIDATLGHKLLGFIDAFSRYNQIRMTSEDEKNIVFIIKKDLYYYKMIPFDLKNVDATYQRLINKIFKQ